MVVRLIRRYAVLFLVGTLWGTQANATSSGFCEGKFADIAFKNERYSTIDDKVNAFEDLKNRCGGTGIYEFRLGNMETRAGRLESAEKTLKYGLSLNTPYNKELKAGLADIAIKRGDVSAAEHAYAELAAAYPDWYVPPQNLGLIKIDQGKFNKAIEYLLTANKIERNAFTYQNLAISYNVTGQHELAVQAMNDAFALNKQAAADVDAMLATAMSYGWLNKFDIADGVLRMLMDARPGIEHSAKFQKALRFLKTRQEQSESHS
jgi:tetratricopeptide (TPR) repeat protein